MAGLVDTEVPHGSGCFRRRQVEHQEVATTVRENGKPGLTPSLIADERVMVRQGVLKREQIETRNQVQVVGA